MKKELTSIDLPSPSEELNHALKHEEPSCFSFCSPKIASATECALTRVNVFLLLVYLKRLESASYECMKSADGSDIIYMYEAGQKESERKLLRYMHTGRGEG